MNIGFIGLGNVGGKLAGSLLRNGFSLSVCELNRDLAKPLLDGGARWADSPKAAAGGADMLITCLPSPAASAEVMEAENGVLAGLRRGAVWGEMSTTDESEVRRLGEKVRARGADALDCPVSGGCHRAATGNISIFVGGRRAAFDAAFPALSAMGRRILHAGDLGAASVLKVATNYLATANLVSLCEALTTCKMAGMDLATTYEAFRISSGNSFVHETESQVILNGSRDINFTMDLVVKDISLFQQIADNYKVPLELSPLLVKIFRAAEKRYGGREWSPNIIRTLEDACGVKITAEGFPAQMEDGEAETPGAEVFPRNRKPA